jgi:hypothetical protein
MAKYIINKKSKIFTILLAYTASLTFFPANTFASMVGVITNPLTAYGELPTATTFLNNIVRLITAIAGIYAFVNFALAGFQYIQSAGNPEGVGKAWEKIYQSIIGLAIVILSYAIAAVLGLILFGNASAILTPEITGPGTP